MIPGVKGVKKKERKRIMGIENTNAGGCRCGDHEGIKVDARRRMG